MNPLLSLIALASTLLAACCAAAEELARIDGSESTLTEAFETTGPWLLDWAASSDGELPVIFELRLIEADSGEFVGPIVQRRRTDQGRRLFDEPGRYRIQVVSQNARWQLVITAVEADVAGRMKRRAEGKSTLEDGVRTASRRVSDDSFVSFRPVDDRTLLLFAADNTHGFRVTFSSPCPGLASATALSFLSPADADAGTYDSIMLDDGTQCVFDKVTPTVFD